MAASSRSAVLVANFVGGGDPHVSSGAITIMEKKLVRSGNSLLYSMPSPKLPRNNMMSMSFPLNALIRPLPHLALCVAHLCLALLCIAHAQCNYTLRRTPQNSLLRPWPWIIEDIAIRTILIAGINTSYVSIVDARLFGGIGIATRRG